jgi:hypothetical protein
MLGRPHILFTRLMLYRALPHRRGEGVPGNVTQAEQKLRRALRIARRRPGLIADLFLLRYNKDLAAAERLYRRLQPKQPVPSEAKDLQSAKVIPGPVVSDHRERARQHAPQARSPGR